MILWGVPLVLAAFVLLVIARNLWATLGALAILGRGEMATVRLAIQAGRDAAGLTHRGRVTP
jgi:microcompartment protein CcmL/EutN